MCAKASLALVGLIGLGLLLSMGSCASPPPAQSTKTAAKTPATGIPYITSRVHLTQEQFKEVVVPAQVDLDCCFVGSPSDRTPKALAWYDKKTGKLRHAVEIRIADTKDARSDGLHIVESGYLQQDAAVKEYAMAWMKMSGLRPDSVPEDTQDTIVLRNDGQTGRPGHSGRLEELPLTVLLRTSGSLNQLAAVVADPQRSGSGEVLSLAERLRASRTVEYRVVSAVGESVSRQSGICEKLAVRDGRTYLTPASGEAGKPFTVSIVNNSPTPRLVRLQPSSDVTLATNEVVVAAGKTQPVQGVGGTPGVKQINYTVAELRPDATQAPQALSKGPLVLEEDGGGDDLAPELYSEKTV